ncbi:MAG TPA: acetylxylan esterase [Gemmataceae bacterium]|nr:acetylxylan esterase [Gemmataceae bacterium]
MKSRIWVVYLFLCPFLLALATPAHAGDKSNLHQQLLDLADRQQNDRRNQFSATSSKADLETLQKSLREKFLRLLGGLPQSKGVPPAKIMGKIDAEDYVIEKLVFESFPGYFVSALLYKPKKITGRLPGIISPCGHSAEGKAASTYQILHINLVKRGYIVLTYDPVGQGERSQFWDADKKKSRFNLVCGEHAVLGNPLYLLGTNLARYRIVDGIRAIDYLASLPEVDAERIGCVGNSGGGTLTAYISALDPRVKAAAIGCYITNLPRRMGNRIQADPDADPEQDIFGFVGEGIDHAGLLALRAPRPTLVASAQLDFFPIEGARESFAEAKKLYQIAGAPERITMVEAAEKHGLSLPLRKAIYAFFDTWLAGRKAEEANEIVVKPRPLNDLLVCKDGQVNVTLQSRHLLTLALEEFDTRKMPAKTSLAELLRLDPKEADYRSIEIAGNDTLVVCVNGNESRPWQEEKAFLQALQKRGFAVAVLDPRGVGSLRPKLSVKGRDYADPLVGVEENLGYNAFLVGKSLLGMRVTDVQAAVRKLAAQKKRSRIILCGRRDAALIVCLTAAIEPSVTHVAIEQMPLTYRWYFDPVGRPINAASILPSMLKDHGDIDQVLTAIAPRKILSAAGLGKTAERLPTLQQVEGLFSENSALLTDWLQ